MANGKKILHYTPIVVERKMYIHFMRPELKTWSYMSETVYGNCKLASKLQTKKASKKIRCNTCKKEAQFRTFLKFYSSRASSRMGKSRKKQRGGAKLWDKKTWREGWAAYPPGTRGKGGYARNQVLVVP